MCCCSHGGMRLPSSVRLRSGDVLRRLKRLVFKTACLDWNLQPWDSPHTHRVCIHRVYSFLNKNVDFPFFVAVDSFFVRNQSYIRLIVSMSLWLLGKKANRSSDVCFGKFGLTWWIKTNKRDRNGSWNVLFFIQVHTHSTVHFNKVSVHEEKHSLTRLFWDRKKWAPSATRTRLTTPKKTGNISTHTLAFLFWFLSCKHSK